VESGVRLSRVSYPPTSSPHAELILTYDPSDDGEKERDRTVPKLLIKRDRSSTERAGRPEPLGVCLQKYVHTCIQRLNLDRAYHIWTQMFDLSSQLF
jgi:hypothetical protein